MQEIGDITKIVIVLGVLITIIAITLTIVLITRKFFNDAMFTTVNSVSPTYAYEMDEMSNYGDPLPVPAIYATLTKYGFDELAQFDMDINGVRTTNPAELVKYFDKKLYVRSVVLPDGIHLWIGDYKR